MALGTVSAGTDVEVLSEALFCIYFAIWKGNGTKKNEYLSTQGDKSFRRVWERGVGTRQSPIDTIGKFNAWANYMGISSTIRRVTSDPAFRGRVNKIHNFINGFPRSTPGLWGRRLVEQQEAFWGSQYTSLVSKTYSAMRADMIPATYNPYQVYESISAKVRSNTDFTASIDKDKWNPSDIWMFTSTAVSELTPFKRNLNNQVLQDPEYKIGYMNALNNKIWDLYESHDLYPVSLKAPGNTVRVTAENQKEGSRDYEKVIRYTGCEYTNDNQDAKINFEVDLWDVRARRIEERNYMIARLKVKTADVPGLGSGGGSRLEIEVLHPPGGARYGTIGTDIQRKIIEQTDNSGIRRLQQIRRRFNGSNGTDNLWRDWWSGSQTWMGRKAYGDDLKNNYRDRSDWSDFIDKIKPYTNALYGHLNNRQVWDPPASAKLDPNNPKVWISKTVAGEVGIAVDSIVTQLMRDITVENLFNVSASGKVQSGTSIGQLKRRLASLDSNMKAEIKAFPPAKANLIWNSCFHLVVK